MSLFSSMLKRSKETCTEIRNRHYPQECWPGVIYTEELRARGGGTILEIGCGRRATTLMRLRDAFHTRIGLDPDCADEESPDSGIQFFSHCAEDLPFSDETFDVVGMQNTAEHLADPLRVLQNCARVLRPGGHLVVQTVNQRFPPIAIARCLPFRLRVIINQFTTGTPPEDTFPVHYRANSMRKLTELGTRAGLQVVSSRYISHHPTYLQFSPLVYRTGIVVERIVRRFNSLAFLRHFLHVVFRKSGSGQGS